MKTKFMLLAALFMLGCDTDSEEKGGGNLNRYKIMLRISIVN